ncbi:MAG: hypothetical protein MI741_05510, partial [Rhodospirillales bacterium]|nr:hypothetical protein [Rhodospirillales bacterium]
MAQLPAGANGRAHDANPSAAGTGNAPIGQPFNLVTGNDVITGNVSGGRGFQDSVGYGAPNEFRDRLGSDDLFQFRAESFGSALGAPNIGGGVSVYRAFSGLPSTAAPIDARLGNRSYSIGGYGNRLYAAPSTGRGYNVLTLPTPVESQQQPSLGLFQNQEGQILQVTASPLFGLRQIEADRPSIDVSDLYRIDQPELPSADIESLDIDPSRFAPNGTRPGGPTDETGRPMDLREDGQRDPNAPIGDANQRAMYMSPSLIIGRQLQTQLAAGEQLELNTQVETRLERLEQDILGTGETEGPKSAYEQLLEKVRTGESSTTQSDLLAQSDGLEAPTQKQLNEAETRRREAIRRMLRQDEPQEGGDTIPEDVSLEGRLAEIMKKLDYDVPAVESFVGEREDVSTDLLKQAEEQFAKGQYFKAESLYRRAILNAREKDPLARVGLSHSLLGAGMIRSSALQLR